MDDHVFYCAGTTAACGYAAKYLQAMGYAVADRPGSCVTDLLLDVPSFRDDGYLRSGGAVQDLLGRLPKDITVFGGNLTMDGYSTVDLLKDAAYVAHNAYITAECALQIAAQKMNLIFRDCPVLIIGWGRIGKSLGQLLKAVGADVTIAARKESDRAMIQALGYKSCSLAQAEANIQNYRLIYNTAPSPVLSGEAMSRCGSDCVSIDLASKQGLQGESVIWARGLPGVHAPESSGRLIAESITRKLKEGSK